MSQKGENIYQSRLKNVREAMQSNDLDALIIPIADPHFGDEIPDHWQMVKWLTGFTGSSATVVISGSFAGLWTDSRYHLQAEIQLSGSGFTFMKESGSSVNHYAEWISGNLPENSTVGFDGTLFSVTSFRKLKSLFENKGIILESVTDFFDDIWSERPSLPAKQIWKHSIEYSGKSGREKLKEVRSGMDSMGADAHLLCNPADIMWLLNVRGNDLRYTPVTLCYSLILKERILLFTDQNKIPVALISEFKESGIEIQPYDLINDSLRNLEPGRAILVSPSSTSISLFGAINEGVRIIEDITIPSRLKAVKNRSEIRNLSEVMARDGAALEKLFFWLENRPADSNVTESSIEEKLLEFRKMQEDFICPSFRTVVAFNEHSAFPHYASSEESNSIIGERGILLIDSGGQYSGGTTDITRTISVGTPTIQQKRDFTLILKGHIALALAKFPSGTRGYQLDILARESLWKYGINFGHGTGHGVGYCLSVHEGPHSISPADIKYSIDAGMLMSNEPAIYRVGEYGIRTENLILCYEDEETEFGTFLKFDTVSLCHIDKHLIDRSILIEEEIKWINSYHLHVFERLSPLLTPAEVSWLKEKTSSL